MQKLSAYFTLFISLICSSSPADASYKRSTLPSPTPECAFGQESSWDWSRINLERIYDFPENFLWGGADSATQTEGTEKADGSDSANSFVEWQEIKNVPDEKRVKHGNHRKTRYEEDAHLIADFGFNIYRISIAWEKVEPQENVFDTQELDWYVKCIDALTDRGVRPMLCFFHHAWPLWFSAKGDFQKRKNLTDFVTFVEVTYAYLLSHVKRPDMLNYLLTFNEPVGYAFSGYFLANHAPNKKDLALTGKVVKNMLDAHAAAYDVLKEINPQAQVSMTFVFCPVHPRHTWHPIERIMARFGNYLLHDVRMTYLKTGYFSWTSYGILNSYNPNVIGKLDFIGLNYYTHRVIEGIKGKTYMRSGALYADNGSDWSVYAEGLMESIKKASEWGLPIIITENGIQTVNDQLKDEYLRRHLYVVHKAIQEGYDIRGYMWWAPIDCFSWHKGWTSYGFYAVDPSTKDRRLRQEAAHYFMETIKQTKSNF